MRNLQSLRMQSAALAQFVDAHFLHWLVSEPSTILYFRLRHTLNMKEVKVRARRLLRHFPLAKGRTTIHVDFRALLSRPPMRHAQLGLCRRTALVQERSTSGCGKAQRSKSAQWCMLSVPDQMPGNLGSTKQRSFTTLGAVEGETRTLAWMVPFSPTRYRCLPTCVCSSLVTHAWGCVMLQNSERAAAAAGSQLASKPVWTLELGAAGAAVMMNAQIAVCSDLAQVCPKAHTVPSCIKYILPLWALQVVCSPSYEMKRPARLINCLVSLSASRGSRASQVRAHQSHDRHSVQ